ncbi:hypothetical protein [Bradyrhizobium viridifuturi]|uniref:hypothetical protein n=1 Tax=Bradyrhizobium viridifuturi TaxID=1654716 RepID=UPI000AD0C335|nr:hypothetical protein [Bradyrhizobium viridifuturi]
MISSETASHFSGSCCGETGFGACRDRSENASRTRRAVGQSAKGEEDQGIRERLLRMAEHYRDLAAHEAWAHENPPSVGALTGALGSRPH